MIHIVLLIYAYTVVNTLNMTLYHFSLLTRNGLSRLCYCSFLLILAFIMNIMFYIMNLNTFVVIVGL